MYSYDDVYSGIEKYMDRELLHKVPGWKKWVLGTGLELALSNGVNIFNGLKDHELVKMLNIINDKDMINVSELYKCLKKQAEHGSITLELPLMGTLTLSKDDVEKLYYYITE